MQDRYTTNDRYFGGGQGRSCSGYLQLFPAFNEDMLGAGRLRDDGRIANRPVPHRSHAQAGVLPVAAA